MQMRVYKLSWVSFEELLGEEYLTLVNFWNVGTLGNWVKRLQEVEDSRRERERKRETETQRETERNRLTDLKQRTLDSQFTREQINATDSCCTHIKNN